MTKGAEMRLRAKLDVLRDERDDARAEAVELRRKLTRCQSTRSVARRARDLYRKRLAA